MEQILEKADRDEKGRFLPGKSGFPQGRPKGSNRPSVIKRVMEIFEEDPEGFEIFVREYIKDRSNSRHIAEMIDGKPKQSLEHTGEASLPFMINITRYTPPQEDTEKVGELPIIEQESS